MILKVICVHDSKAQSYDRPFFTKNTVDALRSWSQICKDPDAPFSKFPSDFALFELGTFDQISGKFIQYEQPVHLSNVIQQTGPGLPQGDHINGATKLASV